MRRARFGRMLVFSVATVCVACGAAQALGATSYPTSDGSDGPCVFNGPFDTDTTFLGFVQAADAGGPQRRVLRCTTITVSAPTIVVGSMPLELRATGDVLVNANLNLGANGPMPGPGGAAGGPAGGNGQGPGGGFAGHSAAMGGDGGAGGPAQLGGETGEPGSPGETANNGGGGGGAGSGGGFRTGSGGGGGGNSNGSSTGGGGGGGGGALRIVTPTQIVVGTAGAIRTSGGLPTSPSGGAPYGGEGGGGSGGSLELIAPTVTVESTGFQAVNASGGSADLANQPSSAANGGNGAHGVITIRTNAFTGTAAQFSAPPNLAGHSDEVTVGRSGSGSGVVTSSPAGISCGADCAERYDPGADVVLTATPASGSTFAGWTGDCAGQGAQCTLDEPGDRAATASFAVAPSTPTTTTTTTEPPPAATPPAFPLPLPPPPGPAVDGLPPAVSAFSLAPRRFRARRGSSLRFTLSEPAAVRIVVERVLPRRRFRRVGTVTRVGVSAGRTRLRFRGRLRGRLLRPGRYRATLTATDAAGNRSTRRRAGFTVVRR